MGGYYLQLAWRRCRQNLPMVGLLVLTLAVGIAACMTALAVFRALAGEPIPGISAQLYVATMDAREVADPDNPAYKSADSYLRLSDARALVDAPLAGRRAALAQSVAELSNAEDTRHEQASGQLVYGPLLQMFGMAFRQGRPWTAQEQAAQAPVVVIDTALAQSLFGEASALGRSVAFNHHLFRVIGVIAPWKPRINFYDLERNQGSALGQEQQFFMPAEAALAAGLGPFTSGECPKGGAIISFQSAQVDACRWIEVWAESPDAASRQATAQWLDHYAQAQHAAGRFAYPPQARLYSSAEWMVLHKVVPNDVQLNLLLAFGFLLLCLVNVAGLLAARFLRRQADVSIRRALGASQRSVFAQHLVETLLLALLGGVLALPLTWLGLWIVRMQPVSYAAAAAFQWTTFGWLLGVSLLVGVLVGLLPAWRICRQPPALQIKLG